MNKIQVFCDFDGTITTRDTVDVLLSELADPQWEEIEERWVRGEIGSRECMSLQIPLIRGGWTKVRELLDTLSITEGVAEFVDCCRGLSIPFVVVSDGLDRVIEYLLERNGIKADKVYANHLIESARGEFQLQSSVRPRLSGCQSGVCKCQIAGSAAYQTLRVVIGDGRSDFCWAKEAEILFAKSKLVDYCLTEGLNYNAFENFYHIKDSLEALSKGETQGLVFNEETAATIAQTRAQAHKSLH